MATQSSAPKPTSDQTFEKGLMESVDIDSLDVNQPRNVDAESAKPRIQQQITPIARKDKEPEDKVIRKSYHKIETSISDMYLPFMRNPLVNIVEPSLSFFVPSSLMFFYVIHELDTLMAQNFYFNRSTTFWHPYVSRLYFSILFIVQTARAMNKVNALSRPAKLFLTQFLDDFPPESLSIPGPLIPFFQALAVSQPNDLNLGKVYPYLPANLGPRTPKELSSPDKASFLWPNVPLLFGFISRITSQEAKNSATSSGTNPDIVDYPSPWNPLAVLSNAGPQHTPVQPVINGVQWSSDSATWTDPQAWSLISPGVNYPVETSDEQNKKFTRYGSQLKIPSLTANSSVRNMQSFLQLDEPEWFARLLPVMTTYAKYFKASGTLADCSPEAGSSIRIIAKYEAPKKKKSSEATPLPRPTYPGDDESRFPLIFRTSTTEYGINQNHQMQAHLTQINAEVFDSHPFFPNIGSLATNDKEGPFWDILPVSHESMRDTGYLQISDVISDHFALEKATF